MFSKSQSTFSLQQLGIFLTHYFQKMEYWDIFGHQNVSFRVPDASDFIIFADKQHKIVLMFTKGPSIYRLLWRCL